MINQKKQKLIKERVISTMKVQAYRSRVKQYLGYKIGSRLLMNYFEKMREAYFQAHTETFKLSKAINKYHENLYMKSLKGFI